MMRSYFPLYSTINGDLKVLPPDEFRQYLIERFLGMRRLNPLFMAGAAAMLYGIANPAYSLRVRRQAGMLMLLTLAYWVYPVLGGKFWNYHELPLVYFLCTGMALAVGPWPAQTLVVQRLAPIVLVLIASAQTFGAFENFAPLFPPSQEPHRRAARCHRQIFEGAPAARRHRTARGRGLRRGGPRLAPGEGRPRHPVHLLVPFLPPRLESVHSGIAGPCHGITACRATPLHCPEHRAEILDKGRGHRDPVSRVRYVLEGSL
ncbi:MAG: hypothetical protein HC888_06345 [Candidatus Competibacteraceae bacterium]|nr:hypothetical protein [Candidatus Competibacteraceae bacterium]